MIVSINANMTAAPQKSYFLLKTEKSGMKPTYFLLAIVYLNIKI